MEHIIVTVAGLCTGAQLSAAEYPLASDVGSVDAIVADCYDVVSGPAGHLYDADRDQSPHAPGAIITRVFADSAPQRHDLATEQLSLREPFPEGFYDYEIGRVVEEYGKLAHVWSTYEIRNSPDGEAVSRGANGISLSRRQSLVDCFPVDSIRRRRPAA